MNPKLQEFYKTELPTLLKKVEESQRSSITLKEMKELTQWHNRWRHEDKKK